MRYLFKHFGDSKPFGNNEKKPGRKLHKKVNIKKNSFKTLKKITFSATELYKNFFNIA